MLNAKDVAKIMMSSGYDANSDCYVASYLEYTSHKAYIKKSFLQAPVHFDGRSFKEYHAATFSSLTAAEITH